MTSPTRALGIALLAVSAVFCQTVGHGINPGSGSSGGGGSFGTLTGNPPDNPALATALAGKLPNQVVVNTVQGQSGQVVLNSASLISTYTWQSGAQGIPTCASTLALVDAYVSDQGVNGSWWTCVNSPIDGYEWVPKNGVVDLAVIDTPFILPGAGTMGNNGALTLSTALLRVYAGAYFYMPAGAIVTSSTAGWYWGTCTTTTACAIFNNTYSFNANTPALPYSQPVPVASPTAFVTTGPGAFTNATGAYVVGMGYLLQGGTMGPHGDLEITVNFAHTNDASTKTFGIRFGDCSSCTPTSALTSTTNSYYRAFSDVQSLNSTTNASVVFSGTNYGGSSGGYNANNTANTVAVLPLMELGATTSNMAVEKMNVVLRRQ